MTGGVLARSHTTVALTEVKIADVAWFMVAGGQ
jgi:hypothetical protein